MVSGALAVSCIGKSVAQRRFDLGRFALLFFPLFFFTDGWLGPFAASVHLHICRCPLYNGADPGIISIIISVVCCV